MSIFPTLDGGCITAGFTDGNNFDIIGNHGNTDGLVVKYSSSGVVEWKKCYGGNAVDYFFSIQASIDGGYIIAGETNSNDGDVIGFHGGNGGDAWIVKIDTLGNIQWQKCYGGTEGDYATHIQPAKDGYIIAGGTGSNNGDVSGFHGGGNDGWVFKINNVGNLQWQKCIGGTDIDQFSSIKITNDGGYVMGGLTQSNDGDVSGNHGSYDLWVVKIDSVGNIQWQKALGGNGYDMGSDLQQTNDNGYIVTGGTWSNDGDVSGNHGGEDIWVVKLDSSGNIQWQRCYGGSSYGDEGSTIIVSPDNDYIVEGFVTSTDGDVDFTQEKGGTDCWILKIDSYGNIIWQKIIGSSQNDGCVTMQFSLDNGIFVAGGVAGADGDAAGNNYYGGNDDYWIVKLNPIFFEGEFCINGNGSLLSNLSGTSYQWQVSVDNGLNFSNIADNANYSGTNSRSLNIISAPTSWYGYKYICVVDGNTSRMFTLTFTDYWIGSSNAAWENPANWNCGSLPDGNTDVIIPSGSLFNPIVNSKAICRSLNLSPSSTCTVSPGSELNIMGK